eukprot:5071876-Pleurochrysis_carterae.AAC.3
MRRLRIFVRRRHHALAKQAKGQLLSKPQLVRTGACQHSCQRSCSAQGHISDSLVSTPVFELVPVASLRSHRIRCVYVGITASLKSAPLRNEYIAVENVGFMQLAGPWPL